MPSPRSTSSESWILNAHLVTQDSRRRILKRNLRIVDGRIAAITTSRPRSRGRNVIDAEGLHILPGFVQAHVHLCQTLFRNQADDLELLDWLSKRIWLMEAAHTAETLRTSALLGIHELLSSGTTCVLDMGTVRHTEEIFRAVEETGIRASVGKCLMDHPSTTPANLREPTRDALAEAQALYKEWHGRADGRIRVSYAPRFVISCTERLLTEIARLSRETGALVHTHASENLKEIQRVNELVHCENIEYLHQLGLTSERLVLAHCIWLKPGEKDILRKTGTHVVHCPSSNLKLASGLAHVPDLRARKINVALGADGAPCNNNLNIFQEMRLAALIHKPGAGPRAMRAGEVLDMATLAGALALGWADSIGSIEVGKRADLVALDLRNVHNLLSDGAETDIDAVASSVVYSTQARDVRFTIVDGRMLYDANKPLETRVAGIRRSQLLKSALKAQTQIRKALR
jgi:cytosine/adenosine deaminase-related metal-dependent hydrolase